MTPAEELTAAADKLGGPDGGSCPCERCQRDEATAKVLRSLAAEYMRETRHFHAMWNDAARERMVGDKWPGFREALALARLINGSES